MLWKTWRVSLFLKYRRRKWLNLLSREHNFVKTVRGAWQVWNHQKEYSTMQDVSQVPDILSMLGNTYLWRQVKVIPALSGLELIYYLLSKLLIHCCHLHYLLLHLTEPKWIKGPEWIRFPVYLDKTSQSLTNESFPLAADLTGILLCPKDGETFSKGNY